MALTFFTGAMVARLLGPELRGIYGSVMVIAQTATALLTFSYYDAAIVWLGDHREDGRKLLTSLLLTSFALAAAAALVLAISSITLVFRSDIPSYYAIFTSILVLVSLVAESFMTVERASLNFNAINAYRVLSASAFCILCAVLLIERLVSVPWLLAGFVVSQAAYFPFWTWKFAAYFPQRPQFGFIANCLRLGLRFHVAFSVNVVANQIDKLLLIKAWPAELVGNYFVAYSAVGAGYSLMSSALSVTLFPIFTAMDAADRREKIHQIVRCATILTIASSLGLVLTIPLLIPLVFGSKYVAAIPLGLGLVAPLALTSFRVIFVEATRSRGNWKASAEMAFLSMATFIGGYAVTGFAQASSLFATMTLAAIVSLVRGGQHMIRAGDLSFSREIVPTMDDVHFLLSQIARLLPQRSRNAAGD